MDRQWLVCGSGGQKDPSSGATAAAYFSIIVEWPKTALITSIINFEKSLSHGQLGLIKKAPL